MADTLDAEPQAAPSIHEQAANGSVEAFNQIAAAHYANADKGSEPAVMALARAVEFGRLAALKGGRREMISFLYLLEQHSHAMRDVGLMALADLTQGQAFALAENMASDGDEEVANMLVKGASEVEPGVLLVARDILGVRVH